MNLNDLDNPFYSSNHGSAPVIEVVSDPFPSVPPSNPSVVTTPTGNEVVPQDTWDEVTQVYPSGVFELLKVKANAYRHETARAMPAVKR